MIEFFTEDVLMPSISEKSLISWLSSTCVTEKRVLNELNVIFCSDEFLLTMNNEHLNHDYYTDIITFDYCFDNQIVGDLFISLDRVSDNATDNNVLFISELNRVLVHCLLHLCGYNKTDDESKLMRSKENHYLSLYVSRET